MTEPMLDRVRVSGPLVLFADGFRGQLGEQGYTACAVQFQLQLLAHLSRWMQDQGVDVGELSSVIVERFLAERRARYASRISLKGLRPLLGYLDGLGMLPVAEESARAPIDELLDQFF